MSFKAFLAVVVLAQLAQSSGWDTEWFSEEKGGWSSFRGFGINGLQCDGWHCDNQKYHSNLELVLDGPFHISDHYFNEQNGASMCPKGYVLAGVRCEHDRCGEMWRYCQKPFNFELHEDDSEWTEFANHDSSEQYCKEGYVANGFQCEGKKCDSIKLNCVKFHNVIAMVVYGEPKCTWGPWFSNEGNWKTSSVTNMASVALRCRGWHCDDLSLYQCNQLAMTGPEDREGKEFSEEQGSGSCAHGKVISGMECRGHLCDNKILHCRKPNEKTFELLEGEDESEQFSSKDEAMGQCPSFHVITGLKCRGSHCDSIILECQEYQINGPAPSCLTKDTNGKCMGYGFPSGYWKQACMSNGSCQTSLETGFETTEEKTMTQTQADLFRSTFSQGYGYNTCGEGSGRTGGMGGLISVGKCHPLGTDVGSLGLKVGPAHASIGSGGVRANVGNIAAASVGPDGIKASVLGGFASASIGPDGIKAKLGFLNLHLGGGRKTSVGDSIQQTVKSSTKKTTKTTCTTSPPKDCAEAGGCSTWQWVNVAEDREGKKTSLSSCTFQYKWVNDITQAPNCLPGWCAKDGECKNCKKPDDGFDTRIDPEAGKLIEKEVVDENKCLNGEGHMYTLWKKGAWFSGGDCGDSTPGDNKYGNCKESDTRYRICNAVKKGGKECLKHDPPIRTADDCARAVAKMINEGKCHPDGIFYTAACSTKSVKATCTCKRATNKEPTYKKTQYGNSILKVKTTEAFGGNEAGSDAQEKEEEAEDVYGYRFKNKWKVKNNYHCGGQNIKKWDNGNSASYDHGHVDLAHCKEICDSKDECDGFVDVPARGRCSYWKKNLSPKYKKGHFCYQKNGKVENTDAGTEQEEKRCKSKKLGQKYDPLRMHDHDKRTVEHTAEACRDRCEQTQGCVGVSFWRDGGCHLTSDTSATLRNDGSVTSWDCGISTSVDVEEEISQKKDSGKLYEYELSDRKYRDFEDLKRKHEEEYSYSEQEESSDSGDDSADIEVEIAESVASVSNFYNLLTLGAICGVAFGIGTFAGSYNKNNAYEPLVDGKSMVELQWIRRT